MNMWKKKNKRFLSASGESKQMLHENLAFTAVEQYKLIRANLDFTLPANEKCPVIGITSATRGEGKSTTSVNLSYVFAEKGSRVLLIDGDLRRPSIARKLDLDNTHGLSDLLRGQAVQMEEYRSKRRDNWYILPSGAIPPNPSELMGSDRMSNVLKQLREMFDYIIIDLPPLNLVSDAIAISPLISGMIVVIRENYTEKKELENCVRQLQMAEVRVLGCVMNGVGSGSSGSSGKYAQYKYYGHASRGDTK